MISTGMSRSIHSRPFWIRVFDDFRMSQNSRISTNFNTASQQVQFYSRTSQRLIPIPRGCTVARFCLTVQTGLIYTTANIAHRVGYNTSEQLKAVYLFIYLLKHTHYVQSDKGQSRTARHKRALIATQSSYRTTDFQEVSLHSSVHTVRPRINASSKWEHRKFERATQIHSEVYRPTSLPVGLIVVRWSCNSRSTQ